ncbi:MAG TPA: hypothetical protein VFD58_13975, partial [Blastocatellia bacterium]|nr:hypothetical protein [Blastocatellia bacterium]
MADAFGQPFRWQSPVVEQAREALTPSLLIVLSARQLGLIAGLFFKDRSHEGRDRFDLMAVCPGQSFFDIVVEACQIRVRIHSRNKLSQVRQLALTRPFTKCVLTS